MELASSDYQASLENINDISVRVKVTVKSQAYQANFDKQLNTLTKRVKINGFRPGKVPKSMVEKLHGKDLMYDVINDLVNSSLRGIASEHKLDVVGSPKVDIKNSDPKSDIEYTAELEVYPKPEIKNYAKFSLEVEREEISDNDVEQSIQHILELKANVTAIEDRDQAKEGDLLDLDVSVAHGDNKHGKSEPVSVVLGKNSLPKEVESALVGVKIGESIDVDVLHKHADHEHNDVYRVKLKKISKRTLPELNDEFVAALNIESKTVADLKNKARESLEQQRKAEVDESSKAKLLEQLAESNSFEIPQALVDQEIRAFLTRMSKGNSAAFSDPNFSIAPFRDGLAEAATKRVKTAIIVDRIAELEKIEPSEEDINKAITEIAMQHGVDVDLVRKTLLQQGQLSALATEILRNKTIDFLLARAKIDYIAPKSPDASNAEEGDKATTTEKKKTRKKAKE